MKILITGGNGFIGSKVVRLALNQGHEVRCLLRATSQTERLAGLAYETASGDVRDPESVFKATDGCDAVVHLASISSWDLMDSPEMTAVVEGGTQNVLRAARERGQIRVVHVSSVTAIDGTDRPQLLNETDSYSLGNRPGLGYSQAKYRTEVLCREAVREGTPVIIVNPAEVYGPDDTGLITAGNLVDFATSQPVLVCHGGTSVVHVDDVAAGILCALERGEAGERYILGGENLTVRQLAEISLDLMGKKHSVVTLPNAVIRAVTRVAGWLRIPLPYNPKVIPYATRYWFVDNAKAREKLGLNFRSARETLGPTVDWLRQAGHIA